MTDEELSRAALILLDMPVFHRLWDEMEARAKNNCVFADIRDHEGRAAHAAEARAIIAFRNRLKALAESQADGSGKHAPA